jgi:uncharacterized membrane protein
MIGIILVAGHNVLDGIVMQGQAVSSIIWYFLHQDNALVYGSNHLIILHYPLIPWIGLMALGYLFGTFYQKDFDAIIRKKWLLKLGVGSIVLFFILRGLNVYGNLVPWTVQDTTTKTILSFLK